MDSPDELILPSAADDERRAVAAEARRRTTRAAGKPSAGDADTPSWHRSSRSVALNPAFQPPTSALRPPSSDLRPLTSPRNASRSEDVQGRAGSHKLFVRGTSAPPVFPENQVMYSKSLFAAAAFAVSQAPGRVYNPLFIYGTSGVGKTHLMQAVAHELLQKEPALRVINMGAEQFTNEYINAIQTRTTNEFRRRFRHRRTPSVRGRFFFAEGICNWQDLFMPGSH